MMRYATFLRSGAYSNKYQLLITPQLQHATARQRSTLNRSVRRTVVLAATGCAGLTLLIGARAWRCNSLYEQQKDFRHAQASEVEVALYRKLPLRLLSRAWGRINDFELPVPLRAPLLGLYVWLFNCDLSEAHEPDLRHYQNLGEFFRRRLKDDARPTCHEAQLVSPADGRVLHVGRVRGGRVEQVKDVNYPLRVFLGPDEAVEATNGHTDPDYVYERSLLQQKGSALFACTIYLAPGDYHRFHSPTDWSCSSRRHFSGELLSVSPLIARWLGNLFVLNERVVYTGRWRHGYFSYTPVGATNVGSIHVYVDHDLSTNQRRAPKHVYWDKSFGALPPDGASSGLEMRKGEIFGEFNLGSSIVLLFEAPADFEFSVRPGQRVKCGQPLSAT